MKTRNSTTPKPAAAKKTPPARKPAAKTPPKESGLESATPQTTEISAASASASASASTPTANVDLEPQQPVEQAKASADTFELAQTKVAGAKTTRKVVVRKTPARTRTSTSAKTVTRKTLKSEQTEKLKAEESSEKEELGDANNVDSSKKEESSISIVEESVKKEEPSVENVEEAKTVEDQNVMNDEESPQEKEDIIVVEKLSTVDLKADQPVEQEKASAGAVEETPESKVGTGAKTTRKVAVRKTPARTKTPISGKTIAGKTLKSEQTENLKAGESSEKEEVGDAMDVDSAKNEEYSLSIVEDSVEKEEPSVENVEETKRVEGQNVMNREEPPQKKDDIIGVEKLPTVDLKAEQPVEQEKASADAVEETPESKVGTGAKTTRKVVVRKAPARTKTPVSGKTVPRKTLKSEHTEKLKAGESSEKEEVGDAMDVNSAKKEEASVSIVEESVKKEEPSVENVEEAKRVEDQNVMNVEEPPLEKQDISGVEKPSTVDLKAEQPVEQEKASADAVEQMPEPKVGTGAKTTRKVVVKKTPTKTKTPISAKTVPKTTLKSGQTEKFKAGESLEKEEVGDVMDVDSAKKEESSISKGDKPAQKGEASVENVEETKRVEDQNVTSVKDLPQEKEEIIDVEQNLAPNVGKSPKLEDVDVAEVSESQELCIPKEEEEVKDKIRDETRIIEDDVGLENEPVNMEEDIQKVRGEDAKCGDECHGNESSECRDQEVFEAFGEEEFAAPNKPEHGEEAETLEEENMEFSAAAKERKMRKELEIFVGGLEHDAVEEDVKKAFENIGDVVEVRLHKNTSIDKNKGYAFVKFATKEQASQALSEMKNPLICGKRCRTGPSEDNDSLFLGNICNTWTKEAIEQKLEDYGIEGVQNITLVADARHEGLSRGFAFIEFSCHVDAMLAYKRLQKPDAIFGHAERTAKVAFAEPLREPDPEVMAQVKSVFIDGLPPNLDEDRVREQMKGYGEIARIMLARNMSTAKRRDFGFVDFTTHEAAVACVEGINDKNLGDGNSKAKVKARLSNPLPKTQAIKGGMCGGFRIGRSGAGAGAGSFSKPARGFGRGAHAFNRPNFQRGRGFYQRGNVPTWRMGYSREHDLDVQYPPFHRREMSGQGGWRDSFRGAHDASRGGAVPARPNLERGIHNAPVRGRGMPIPTRRQPFLPGEGFNRTFGGRQYDDPYFYDGDARGTKRPFFMTDQDPNYVEPSRHRPRLDYSDPEVPFHPPRYQDSFGAGSSRYSHDYYGPDYGEGSYPSFYGNDRPYGGGYYY